MLVFLNFSFFTASSKSMICLSSFVTTLAGWQFKAFAKHFLVNKDAIAQFFGNFNFYAGLLALAVQLFVTSRLLKRFGIGPALFVVPTALLLGSIGVLITDHNVRETLQITDHAYIISQGKIFRQGTPAELAADPGVRSVYLGEHFRLH